MRVARLLIASCMLATGGTSVASAQFVNPFKVLEEAKRDRLERDRRLAREVAERQQKEKAEQAAKVDAQRKLDQQRSAASPGTVAAAVSAEQAGTPPGHAPSSEVRNPPVIASNAGSGASEPNQAEALAARGTAVTAALSPDPSTSTTNGVPSPSSIAASPNPANAPGAPLPTITAPGAANATPAPTQPQPLAAPARDMAKPAVAAPARVLITVDKATQRMRVTVAGKLRYSWAVSTGRAPYKTPAGTFRPFRLEKEHYSREWDDAPMPYSIFFTAAGHAIHASNATRQLGRPASHGCVRLAPSHAAALFTLVRAEGPAATKVTITNGASVGRTARSRSADVRARGRAHHAQRGPSDIWQAGFGDAWTE
ncbi:lipoprotein-anchoring transpeptidase ErfK/SrfK [Methylobacterium sp. RAS18]|nr:lipoprotein-anchoring transpeptidase ErfK/SrfK [Methylobacterium sp. RAS18]